MSTKKAIGDSFTAIFILLVSQLIAQGIACAFGMIKVPSGVRNIIAGALYAGLAYVLLKVFAAKIVKLPMAELGMPEFAVLLPVTVKGIYLLAFGGRYVSSHMSGTQIFDTLSAGIAFTGIAAGFVEEMVFRGIILNVLKKKWNLTAAVIVPSIAFGFVHILGMDFSVGSCLLVILAGTMVGIMFSLIAVESGSVWNSGMVHAVWNVVMIGGGLAIGEKADAYSVMTYVLDSQLFAVTGGEFGVEASAISLAGYIIVAGMALAMLRSEKKAGRTL